ncbi:Amuc_1100 family pilus-like protein [Pontiella sulfatireligans]|uniref:Uncharacterized protein n=1 Tax=Pontiella sulfatireligans TaxID=2750658 RepID=A0A6C2UN35_9BACT|nr:Amuc_1100 family pilus-like protein [Pontiella sulfatireligans]VGO21588.1 hypothetical protein SCARR_03662 [Pontiella sulfatireligans]
MNLKNNLLRRTGIGVCAAMLLAEATLLVVARVELGRQSAVLKRNSHRLSALHARAPFPSPDNVARMEKSLERLEYQVGELAAAAMRDPFPQEAVEAADFSARAQGVIERFQARAQRAGVTLPASLEVGFSQYASGGAVPDVKHLPRLSRQLYSTDRVADVLVRGGVTSIESLSRDVFEVQAGPEEMSGRRPRRGEAPPPTPMKKGMAASATHPDGLYMIERIGVAFTAGEDEVWRVLDLFASASRFMAVAGFSHQTQAGILSYNPEELMQGGAVDDETLRYLSEGILVGKKALSRSERIIAGNEPIRVELLVDVYNFIREEDREGTR